MAKNSKSIEEQVEDWCKKQFKSQKYYTKTETVNAEIATALEKATCRSLMQPTPQTLSESYIRCLSLPKSLKRANCTQFMQM